MPECAFVGCRPSRGAKQRAPRVSSTLVKRMIPEPMRAPLGRSRRYSAFPGLSAAQLWPLGELMAALAGPQQPPILLVSLPRGGSTWAGRTLGASEQALYLHEPVTQSYLQAIGGKGASEFEYGACRDRRAYDRGAALAFRGVPRFAESVVVFPEQWQSLDRRRRRVVVKEVNPLALDVLIGRFRPRVVYLLRHPVAVARSYRSLGWDGERQFGNRFTPQTLSMLERDFAVPRDAGFWEKSGALQAIVQHRAMAALASWPDHRVVRYEDLCRDPVGTFAGLFEFCGLPLSERLRQEIERTTSAGGSYRPGGSDTARDSRAMIDRWKQEVEGESIAAVRRGYFANRPLFYQEEADW